jgi:hypothetical protein
MPQPFTHSVKVSRTIIPANDPEYSRHDAVLRPMERVISLIGGLFR